MHINIVVMKLNSQESIQFIKNIIRIITKNIKNERVYTYITPILSIINILLIDI